MTQHPTEKDKLTISQSASGGWGVGGGWGGGKKQHEGRGSLLPGIFWTVWSVPANPDTSENESVQEEEAQQDQIPPEPPPQWWHFTINPLGQWCPHERCDSHREEL